MNETPMSNTTLLVLSAEDVHRALPMATAIAAMRTAFTALANGRAELPGRTHLDLESPPGTALFMPSYLPDLNAIGIKTVTLVPENRRHNLPLLQGLFCLFDARTGTPQALLDAGALTAIRTGAVSGLATDLLARPDACGVAIFGAGVQGRAQLAAVCAVRPITRARVFDPDPRAARQFVDEQAVRLGLVIEAAPSPAEALRDADIVCTATVATQPVFADSQLPLGTHINAVGSYQPHVQEIPSATVCRARLIVDHRPSALAETGDLIIPLAAGQLSTDQIAADLGELVIGKVPGRTAPTELTLFKSVGLAIQDLAAAQAAVDTARSQQWGPLVPM